MKILLLGATGRTGLLILEQAIQRGIEVNCLVRDIGKIKQTHQKLQIFQGNTEDTQDLERAIEGCHAVISVLNISRKSDFPWSKLRTNPEFLSRSMSSLIKVAKQQKIKRLIVCSAWGVADTKNDLPKWFKWFIDHSNIGVAYQDHERQEILLEASDFDWTIVRPSGLTNSKKPQQIIESLNNHPKPKLTISRLSVAKYMIETLLDGRHIRSKIVISTK